MNAPSSCSDQLHALVSRVMRRSTESLPGFAEIDSITKLELVLAVEAEFGIELTETELGSLRSLDELVVLVDHKRPNAPDVSPVSSNSASGLMDPLPSVPVAAWPWAAGVISSTMRFFFRMQVSGADRIHRDDACLLCANHTSHLDSAVLLAAAGPWRDRLVFAAAKDYFFSRRRAAGWAARALPMIPWERGGDVAAMRENLRQLAACRAAGRIIVFFPEGGRSLNGELQPFKEGLEFFAARLNLPVMPCWIDGAHRALRKGASLPRPGRLTVTFGNPIRMKSEDRTFAAEVRARMLALRPVKRA